MSLKLKNSIISLLAVSALYQILVVKSFSPAIWSVIQKTEEFWYDISLAFFTGALVYVFTSGWSNLIIKKERKKIIFNELDAFLKYSLERLESIEAIDFSNDKDTVREQFKKLTYASKAKPKARNTNTIYDILEKINVKKERLYLSCIPLIHNSNNMKLLGRVYKLFNNDIFLSSNEYKTKDKEDIQDHFVGIGGYFYSFYEEVTNLKKILK